MPVQIHLLLPEAVTIDVTDDVVSARYSYDAHGCATAMVQLRNTPRIQASALLYGGKLIFSDWAGGVAWGGRIESIDATYDTTTIVAYGLWRALGDAPYTALWSATSTADWTPLAETEHASGHSTPHRYEMDTNNRLYIAPRKNEIFGTTGEYDIGALAFRAPSGGSRLLTRISFDWLTTLPSADWRLRVADATDAPYNAPWTFVSATEIVAGSGSGTATVALSTGTLGCVIYLIRFATDAAYTGETGAAFARITNVRVTSATPPIRSSDIIKHAFDHVQSQPNNERWLIARHVATTSDDVHDAVYEDADVRAVIDDLCARTNMIASVDAHGVLTVRSMPSIDASPRWVIAPHVVQISRSVEDMITQLYARYRTPGRQTLRTYPKHSFWQDITGFTRIRSFEADTTSVTSAEALRDALLESSDDPSIRVCIRARHGDISGWGGAKVSGSMLRAYDALLIEGAPGIEALRIGRVTVDALTGETEIETLTLSDTLENAIAQR